MLRNFAVVVAVGTILGPSLDASAQVVQLPTFEAFGIGTTVNVPTGGSASLGGMSRSGASRVGGGVPGIGRLPGVGRPFGNRATSSSLSGGSMRVTATIHDFEAMDQMVLSQAAARRGSLPGSRVAMGMRRPEMSAATQRATSLGSSSAERPADGLEEIRRQRQLAERAKTQEVYLLIDKASTARGQGKVALAKMYYRMAWKRAEDDQLRRRIADLLASVVVDKAKRPVAENR